MNKTAKIVLAVVLVILVIWGFVSVQNNNSTEPIKIGVPTILSGDFAVAGENIVNAVKIAIEDVNIQGGVNGRQLLMVPEDSKCDSKGGLSAVSKLVNVDGVRYMIGGMCSNGTLAAAPLANEKHALIMTPVTGGKNVDEAGEYIFRIANSDILAGRDIAQAMLKKGYTRVGVISAITEYTLDIKNTFEQVMKSAGATVVISEEFQPGTNDYRTLIGKIKNAKPQAILVLSQLGTDAAKFIKQSRELGLQVPLFTDFTLIVNDNAKKIAGSYEGIYFADPAYGSDTMAQVFFDRYEEVYKIKSAIPFHAASSYDAVMMYVDALRAVGDDSVEVKDWLLANVKNRKGLMGTFSLDSTGNSDLGFVIKQVKGDQFIEVK
ncbi:amino acid ABC transporter substrate-binding protein [Patescibacteria group bacterium]|nr:MAG: amino acid ABC transporter substrate-binding protein [Patescibacteria group bacterium]